MLKPGGVAYICVNGDGWYEFLIDERFRDKPEDFVVPLAEPIWNALHGPVERKSLSISS